MHKLSHVIANNIPIISNFLVNNIYDAKISNTRPSKVAVNCPYCDENRRRHKLVINLDHGGYYRCFRCGATGSLFSLCKHFNIQEQLLNLFSELTDYSVLDIYNLIKNNNIDIVNTNEIETDYAKQVKNFIREKALFSITDLPSAYKYALSRTYNNKIEIESYLADDKYIYIPIITDDILTSYVSRLYVENENCQRYIIYNLVKDKTSIGFFDNVVSNMTSNSVYITEGYFDSYAINYAMSNYVSVCAFGKSKVVSVAEKLSTSMPLDTRIYLTLDSLNKDNNIAKDNIKYGKKIANIFPNLYIVELPDMDPAEILDKNGPMELKKELKNYSLPFIKYCIKYAFR